jgi:hypothetical protein
MQYIFIAHVYNQNYIIIPPIKSRMDAGMINIPIMTMISTINLNQHNVHKWAILDSGATSHFLLTTAPTTNKKVALNPLHITMPDGDQVQSTHTCDLDVLQLPMDAQNGHIISGLAAHSLLSIVKQCNASCDVTLSKI